MKVGDIYIQDKDDPEYIGFIAKIKHLMLDYVTYYSAIHPEPTTLFAYNYISKYDFLSQFRKMSKLELLLRGIDEV